VAVADSRALVMIAWAADSNQHGILSKRCEFLWCKDAMVVHELETASDRAEQIDWSDDAMAFSSMASAADN